MKQVWIPLLTGLAFACTNSAVTAQDAKEKSKDERKLEQRTERRKEVFTEAYKEHISKQYTIQQPAAGVLTVYNLEGSVSVEGYAGDKILIEIDQAIYAKDKETLEQGKKEVRLGFEQIGDSVVSYIAAPWDTRPHDWRDTEWDGRRRIEYSCNLEYKVKVPFACNIRVSTVNDGNVLVKDVAGRLHVGNVNGGIKIINAKNTTWAHTVNGDLTVNYVQNPQQESSFYTLNGTLTAVFQPGLSADVRLKTMNGAYYTDFDDVQVLPTSINLSQDKKSNGTVYRINKNSDIRIGSGGRLYKFETLNGNIYIKKQS
jgi:hypothetical protein